MPLKIFIFSFLLDILLGDPENFPHPVRLIGKAIEKVNRFLFIFDFKTKAFINGIILFIIIVSGTSAGIIFLLILSNYLGSTFFLLINIYLLYSAIALKDLKDKTFRIYKALSINNIELARYYLSHVVGRDTKNLSEHEIVRGTVETIAEGFTDGVVSPMFYFFFGGNILVWIYKAINTLDSMVGYNFPPYTYYGRFSAKIDDMFNFIPARLSVVFILFYALIGKKDFKNGIGVFKKYRKNHPSPNGGNPESAMAGILGIRLGGINYYKGHKSERGYIGIPKKPLKKEVIKEAIDVLYGASFLLFVIEGLFLWIVKGF